MLLGLSYVHQGHDPTNLYIRNIIPEDASIPLLEHLALSGRGDALFTQRRGI